MPARVGPVWKGRGRDGECFLCGKVLTAVAGLAHLGDGQHKAVGPDCHRTLLIAAHRGVAQRGIGTVMYGVGFGPGPNGEELGPAAIEALVRYYTNQPKEARNG